MFFIHIDETEKYQENARENKTEKGTLLPSWKLF